MQFASDAELRNSRGAIGDAPAFVQHNAIDFQAQVTPAGHALRRRLSIDDDALLIGIFGRVHPRKGFEVIVPALADAPPRTHLVSFGMDEANHRRKVQQLAERCGVGGRVHFVGHLDGDALQSSYASVDLVVLPSLGESFGNTAVEALAQGTEVLLSDRVPLGGYVRDNGLGEIVAGLDPADWSRALAEWAGRHTAFDRSRAARIVREEFGVARAGENLLAAYRSLLAEPAAFAARRSVRTVS